jgi:ketosteroid isomerase-like protein
VSDLIRPPAARRPAEALEFAALALSDGDLEAALAQYDEEAVLAGWPRAAGPDIRCVLAGVMALRLPISVRVWSVLEGPGVALVVCERQVAGTGPDGEPVRLDGQGCAVLRPQPDGTWRIAADAWHTGPGVPR